MADVARAVRVARVTTVVRDLFIFGLAVRPSHGQDFLSLYTAAHLVRQGEADAAWLPADATHLFAADPLFVRTALDFASGALPAGAITGQVAPPPSLLPVLPLLTLSFPVALLLWRLAMAVVLVVGLRSLGRGLPDDARLPWASLGLLSVPVFGYALSLGQSAPLLLGAGAALLATTRSGRWWIPPAVAAVVVYKVTPVLLAVLLLVRGRHRMAIATTIALAIWILASLPFLPPALYPAFLDAMQALGSGTLPAWPNLSVDAALARAGTQTGALLVDLPPAVQALAWLARVLLVGTAGFVALRSTRCDRAWAAAWVALLALSPLLWLHYLVLLPVLFLPLIRQRGPGRIAALGITACASGVVVLGHPATWVGQTGTMVWLATALAVLVGSREERA